MPLRQLGFLLLLCNSLAFAEQHFASQPQQTQLIELYTSEGCHSCPPADRWLSRLLNDTRLWTSVVPVAFHVDYWDDLGWPDRFAHPAFTHRQRLHANRGNIRQPGTPGFVVDGEEWRGFFRRLRKPEQSNEEPGVLTLTVKDQQFTAQLKAPANDDNPLVIALLGSNLKTQVKAGENRGELLRHDFVVLAIKYYLGENNQWQGKLPRLAADVGAENLAIAAWVEQGDSLKPIQAVGGLLNN